jgi:signal peptidase II
MAEDSKPQIGSPHLSPALRHLIFWPIFIAGLALDLWSKDAVFSWLKGNDSFNIIDGFLRLQIAVNPGAAFGIAAGHRWKLIAVSVGALIAIGVVLFSRIKHRIVYVILGLLAAGVSGNLYDRLFHGGLVRDFIDVYWRTKHWPAFNVADSMLCIAVGLLFIYISTHQSCQKPPQPQK